MKLFQIVTIYSLTALIGLCVGSFLNVVIYRVPKNMSLIKPPSHCPKCGYFLRWYDNVPVLSYLFLGGKCRKCREHISFRYTAVELINTVLWGLCIFLFWNKSIPFACIAAVASSVFLCVFFIDLEHKLIFDRFVLILLALGVASMFLDPDFGWRSHLIGGISGFVAFYLIALAFRLIRHKEGLGGGDIKLTAVAGLLLGWQRLILSILIASISASVVLLILTYRAKKKQNEQDIEYPFAPFLTTAFLISLFFGSAILSFYLGLLGF